MFAVPGFFRDSREKKRALIRMARFLFWVSLGLGLPAQPKIRPYAVIPGILVSPEVGVGLGAVVFHSALPRIGSRFDLKFLATTREQFQVRLRHRLVPADKSRKWRSEIDALLFPDSYFGGRNNPKDGDEHYY